MSTTLKTHSPLLVNAEAMALDHPQTFKRPSDQNIAAVELRDHVKINVQYVPEVIFNGYAVSNERFWVEVVLRSSNYWIGQVKNQLLTSKIELGSLVKFHPCNIYDICKHEEES